MQCSLPAVSAITGGTGQGHLIHFMEATMQQIGLVVRRLAVSIQVFSLMVLLLATCTVRAQIAGAGNIQGTVTDPTGAVIPNAIVTLTEESTQVKRTAKSDSGGVYIFPNINVGTYSVTVGSSGFETYTKTGNVLEVGSNISINVTMTVGRADQKVEVHSDSLALQTEDVSFKQTIDQRDITEMPLNGRQLTSLLTLSGGTAPAAGNDFANGSKYSYQTIAVSVTGGMGNSTLWRLDGGDNNDYMGNGNLPFPFPDAVSQFSVESTGLGAQDGMHAGGMVNMVTRSGSNLYHGAAFEFIRNNIIDATNFYVIPPNGPGSGKDRLHQNQYGGTFGGPVRIPKLFNGTDKLFFFAGYQFLESKSATGNTTAHVPTAANLAGDFSITAPPTTAAAGASGACQTTATQLVDPLTGAALPGNKYNQPGGPALPTFNPQSLALLKYLPPINPNVDINNCGVVQYAIPSQLFDKQFVTRVDYTLNAKNNLYARYLLDGYQLPAFFFPNNILVTTQSGNPLQRVQTFTLGESYSISSRTVNSAHVTVLRRVNNRGYNPSDINAGNLGVNLTYAVPVGLQLTANKFTIGGGTNSVSHFNDNTLAFDDDVTMVRGRHQIVFGGEFVRNQLNITNSFEGNGFFTFGTAFSSYGPSGVQGSKPKQIGDGSLDFLEGTMSAFVQSKEQQNALRAPIPSLYVQDTFHATKKMTIVAGLRWDPEFMPVDVFNRGSIFSMSAFLANQHSSVYPTAPAGSLYYGDPGVPRGFTQNSPWQFDPNVGISYDISGNGKTVVRAGAEYIYDEPNFFTGQRINQNPPFATAISQAANGYIPFSTPWNVPAALQSTATIQTNPFPSVDSFTAKATATTAVFTPNLQYIVLPTRFRPAATMQWTASIQHEFPHGWQLQFDYIGNKSSHDQLGLPLNPVQFIPGNWNGPGSCVAPGIGAITGTGTGPCSTTSSSNYIARSKLVLTNPSQGLSYSTGGAGSVFVGDEGMSNYNGLITSINHRLSSTFSLLANWTWSKCLDIEDNQGDVAGTTVENPNNPAMDYGPCGFDYRHIENIVIVAKSQFSFSNRIERATLNNWEFAPLIHIQSGAPFNVTAGPDNSLTDVNNDRPNLVQGVPVYQKVKFRQQSGVANREYLNPAAFAQIPTSAFGTYGNISRNAFRAPPAFQMDAQVSRIFPIYERLAMTLRLEAYNVLNHPNFGSPDAKVSDGAFGQISGTNLTTARVFQGVMKFTF
jgi:Carboxypeptidase regulatory-like domain